VRASVLVDGLAGLAQLGTVELHPPTTELQQRHSCGGGAGEFLLGDVPRQRTVVGGDLDRPVHQCGRGEAGGAFGAGGGSGAPRTEGLAFTNASGPSSSIPRRCSTGGAACNNSAT
jgi:hypothetical protein